MVLLVIGEVRRFGWAVRMGFAPNPGAPGPEARPVIPAEGEGTVPADQMSLEATMARPKVLIVDDEENARVGLGHSLRGQGYELQFAESALAALELLKTTPFDVVISDQRMPGMTGLELLTLVRDRHPDTVRIMLTGETALETCVEAINRGEIYRFLQKPVDRVELRTAVFLACDRLALERRNRRLLALIRTSPELQRQLDEEDGARG